MQNILVTQAAMPPMEEYFEEIASMWQNHWLTNMGEKHERLRHELTQYLKVPSIDLLVNGHMALELTLQALNLQGEVVTTPFTFASTTHSIVRNGLTPVFCDIDPITYTMDTTMLEELITDRTCAILPVHVYGNVCNIEEIERIARKHELKVIYDAAHAFGEEYNGKGIGSFGIASCFSFHATKVFNTIEGGAVCYSDSAFGEKIYELKNFGIHDAETVAAVGANAKMNEFCAAMGLCNLHHIEKEIQKRGQIVEHYRARLGGIEGLQLNVIQKNVKTNYAYFPIVIDEKKMGVSREEIYEELIHNGIYSRKYFFPLTNSFPAFDGRYSVFDTPVALYISKRVLTLPLYAALDMKDVDRICDIILKMIGR